MKSLKIILIGIFAGFLGAYLFKVMENSGVLSIVGQIEKSPSIDIPVRSTAYVPEEDSMRIDNSKSYLPTRRITNKIPAEDFTKASRVSTESVVYIKTISERYSRSSWLELWLGGSGGATQRVGSGSGVIFSDDGYIITNNHVIDEADAIEVVYKKRSFPAQLVGRDPSTDLAVLKIDRTGLPAISIGNSKEVEVGEWVLAVGNPFNLNSTVTAGIVSAKGRELNILKSNFPIESFIQTDAAINPGNSGGALVNLEGELIGINTAILSRTGSYAGYGFAVPVDIVNKIAGDIIEYGAVQKAFLGAEVISLDAEIAEKLNTGNLNGVVVGYINQNGAAEKAGLQKGDIIRSVDGQPIDSRAYYEEMISLRSPGDKLRLTIERKGNTIGKEVTLTNSENTTDIIRREVYFSKALGVEFESVSEVEQNLLGIESGVKVVDVKNGFFKRMGIEEGFIITAVNNIEVDDPKELASILVEIKGQVIVQGVNKRGVKGYYTYNF